MFHSSKAGSMPNPELIPAPSSPMSVVGRVPLRLPLDDATVVHMWIHGKAAHTRIAYATDYARWRLACRTPLRYVTLEELQMFCPVNLNDAACALSPASQGRAIASVKALLSFAHRLGYLQFDVGQMLKMPTLENKLAERILHENKVLRLIELEPNTRNRVLLRLLYASAGRVTEVSGLIWIKIQGHEDGTGQVTFFGKGSKTRHVFMTAPVYQELMLLRGDAGDDSPVFPSRKSGCLKRAQVWRIVRAAARRAGITVNVSPHWFRHAHASHALDRGAPISLVQATLGHASIATTGKYLHARPGDGSMRFLAV
jgi:integrase/recombinase XerD